MSRITVTEQAVGASAPAVLPVEPEPAQAPKKQPSKTDAAKADVAIDTEETP